MNVYRRSIETTATHFVSVKTNESREEYEIVEIRTKRCVRGCSSSATVGRGIRAETGSSPLRSCQQDSGNQEEYARIYTRRTRRLTDELMVVIYMDRFKFIFFTGRVCGHKTFYIINYCTRNDIYFKNINNVMAFKNANFSEISKKIKITHIH